MHKRIIVACGSGVATSQMIASKISCLLEEDGISYPVEAVDYKAIQQELPSADVYVYVAQPDDEVLEKASELGVRVLPGVPFLTGMGADEVYEQLKESVSAKQ